jgi:hypothetical protein
LYFYAALSSFWTLARGESPRAESAPVAGGGGPDLWPGEKELSAAQARASYACDAPWNKRSSHGHLARAGSLWTTQHRFLERVNLTVRHGVAALARRTWATAKLAPQLLAHLEWWRAYYHFVRPHAALRMALVQPAAARWQAGSTTLPTADGSSGSGENQPTVDSTRSALFPFVAGAMLQTVSVNEARRYPAKWQ